jgi:hypothetical protein
MVGMNHQSHEQSSFNFGETIQGETQNTVTGGTQPASGRAGKGASKPVDEKIHKPPGRTPKKIDITIEELKSLVSYDPLTGEFTTLVRRSFRTWVGKRTGTTMCNGYIKITLGYRQYLAHRLAWFYTHGEWPQCELDHKNLIVSDNRIENLRCATDGQNKYNRKKSKLNTSGIKGVQWSKQRNRWQAVLRQNNKCIHCGFFHNIEDAKKAVRNKRVELHGEFANHG